MGASGWIYYAEFDPDPSAVLASLRQRVLADREYYWADESVPRPASFQELRALWSDERHQRLAEDGTHSILDIDLVAAGTEDQPFVILPLAADTMLEKLGTHEPTREVFDAAHKAGVMDDFPRWSGRFTTLWENGAPAVTVMWGYSGD
jgi:hypothetical protein